MTAMLSPPDINSSAVRTPARDISHLHFAGDIAAARIWLTQHIVGHAERIILSANLHSYLSWVLRVALLAERRWQIQEAHRTPAPHNAVWIVPNSSPSVARGIGIELMDLKQYRTSSDPIPVWEILSELHGVHQPLVTLYTSGSTGQPKGVVLTGDMIAQRMDTGASVYGFQATDLFQCRMGPDTVGGFYLPMEAWRAGASVLCDPKLESTGHDGMPLCYHSTVIMSSTTGFDNTLQLEALWPNKSQRRVFLAGSRVHVTLADDVFRLIADHVYVVYGSTECGATAHTPAVDLHKDPTSVGSVLPRVELSILSEKGEPLPFNVQGRVAVRSPWSITAYEGDRSGSSFQNGWFLPGDLGILSPEGQLKITGRSIETLNYGGEKFVAGDLESQILLTPGVRDAFVTVIQHNRRERLVIMIATNEPAVVMRRAITSALDKKLAFTLVPVDHIPRNHMGKLNRPELTESIAQNLRIRPFSDG